MRMMEIAIIPHNDDEVLYLSYTLLRRKPLVVLITDSYIQPERGDTGCSAEERRNETLEAMSLFKCPVVFMGIKDTELTEDILRSRLGAFPSDCLYYAPAVQGGNRHHDMAGLVSKELFDKVVFYTTYTKTELWTRGVVEIKPTETEIAAKNLALQCYKSQIALPGTVSHFKAVMGKSEWYA